MITHGRFRVVFEAASHRWISRTLSWPQHCYVAKKVEGGWVIIDPVWSHIEVRTEPDGWVPGSDSCIIETYARICIDSISCAPGLMTCVDVVKRTLGIRSIFIQTPRQLLRYLEKQHGQGINS